MKEFISIIKSEECIKLTGCVYDPDNEKKIKYFGKISFLTKGMNMEELFIAEWKAKEDIRRVCENTSKLLSEGRDITLENFKELQCLPPVADGYEPPELEL